MHDFIYWSKIVLHHWVPVMTSSILALLLAVVQNRRNEPIPWPWMIVVFSVGIMGASYLVWSDQREALEKTEAGVRSLQAALQAEKDTRGEIDLVHPWLRYAYGLENYDGSSEKAGNRDRVITRSSPPVKLHYSLYSEENPVSFVFGVQNGNKKASIRVVGLTIKFLDERVRVIDRATWVSNLDNYEYVTGFALIPAQVAQNAPKFQVLFPHPGTYTIRIEINALDLGEAAYDLRVILE